MTERMIARITEAHKNLAAGGDGGPAFLGANCMGVISRPGKFDTWFIPAAKMPDYKQYPRRRTAIVSQSGAFLLNRFSQTPEMSPSYLISMGNQTDLTLGDMMRHFMDSQEVDVIAVYAEGFKDLDGIQFAEAVREAIRRDKQVVFYKAGGRPKARRPPAATRHPSPGTTWSVKPASGRRARSWPATSRNSRI